MIDVDSDAALMATRLMEDTQSSSGDAFLREEMRHRFFFFLFFFLQMLLYILSQILLVVLAKDRIKIT